MMVLPVATGIITYWLASRSASQNRRERDYEDRSDNTVHGGQEGREGNKQVEAVHAKNP